MKRRLVLACLAGGLLCWVFFVTLAAGAEPVAGGKCTAEYVVRAGDTLNKIAAQFDLTLAQLRELNSDRLRWSITIYVGEKLCVAPAQAPTPKPPTPEPRPITGGNEAVAVEVTYRFPLTDTEEGLSLTTRGGLLGKRAVYPLQGLNAHTVVSTTGAMIEELTRGPAPVLLAVATSERGYSTTHALVGVGDDRVLGAFLPSQLGGLHSRLSPASQQDREHCVEPVTLREARIPVAESAEGRLFLEEGDRGTPLFNITGVDLLADRALAARCYGGSMAEWIDLALLPGEEPGAYRAIVRNRPPGGELAVTVEYGLAEAGAALAGSDSVRRRVSYPIRETSFFSTSQALAEVLGATPKPVLLGYRIDEVDEQSPYALIEIGDTELLKAISLTQVLTPSMAAGEIPLPAAEDICQPFVVPELAVAPATAVSLTVSLENRDGTAYPFPVALLATRPSPAAATECYQGDMTGAREHVVGFVVSPVGEKPEDGYRVAVRLQGEKIGPPGIRQAARCRYWPSRGRFNRWVRSWFGCR